jgi:hypothetical protein
MGKFLIWSIGIIALLLSSCDFSDREEATVPSYIHIPNYVTETPTDGSKGSSFQRFHDVWVYVNGRLLGLYGLPANIPVPNKGPTTIRIEAGILKSGQLLERMVYPVIQTYETTISLTPKSIDTIVPVFRYRNNAAFPVIEDFDRIGFRFTINPLYQQAGDTVLRFKNADAHDTSNFSGRIQVQPDTRVFQMYTTETYALPGFNQPVFWEMDYNTDLPLVFGYYYIEPNQSVSISNEVIRLFPTNGQWNRVYIALNQEIAPRPIGTRFRFYIGFFKQPGATANVMLDNLKLTHLD